MAKSDPDFLRLHEAFSKFVASAGTVKKQNTSEWMEYFCGRANEALAALDCDSRFIWPGPWAEDFHFEVKGNDN